MDPFERNSQARPQAAAHIFEKPVVCIPLVYGDAWDSEQPFKAFGIWDVKTEELCDLYIARVMADIVNSDLGGVTVEFEIQLVEKPINAEYNVVEG